MHYITVFIYDSIYKSIKNTIFCYIQPIIILLPNKVFSFNMSKKVFLKYNINI